jgi:hypothetical protein
MKHRIEHVAPGALSLLEILVLGPLAAFLTIWLVPGLVGLEWQCVGTSGVQRVGGDTYLSAVVVAGTFGWLLVMVGAIYAQIGESRRLAAVLPLVWFSAFVAGALIYALALGPESCLA